MGFITIFFQISSSTPGSLRLQMDDEDDDEDDIISDDFDQDYLPQEVNTIL